MKYQRVEPDRRLLEITAPVGVVGTVFNDKFEIYMIAGTEGDDLVCYAVYSHFSGNGSDVFLEYVYTVPDRRDEGMCTALLEESAKRLEEMGVLNILIRQIIDPDKAWEFNGFFTKRGFIPLYLKGHMLYYRLEDMLDAEVIQTVLKHEKQLPQVKDINSIPERSLKALLSKQNETGFFFYRDECDERLGRFYEEDGVIHAAMIVSWLDEDTLFISSVYTDAVADKKNLFMILFSEVVYAALKDTKNKKLDFTFVVNSEAAYKGLFTVFNPPDREFLMLEYMKCIGLTGD